MSGKYLKARKLAKEMEEKAERTAKKKEEIEEKRERAEKLLEITEDLDIDAGQVKKKMEEGRKKREDKDFEEAGKKFEEVIEECQDIHSDRLDEMLGSVKGFLNISTEEEIEESSTLREEVEEAENLLEEGEIKDSLEKAEEIQKKSKSIFEREINDQLENVKSLLERVEEAGKKKGKAEKLVLKVDYAYEGGEYDRSISLIRDARELIGDKLRDQLDELLGKLETKMKRLEEKEIDISRSRDLFRKAKESKGEKDYGKTVRYVQMCQDRVDDHFVDILRKTVENLEDEIEEAKEIGVPVRTVEEMLDEIESRLDDRKVEEAGGLLDEAFEKVKELKFEEVLNTIAESREYFIKAKEIDANISEPMQMLSTARDSLEEGDYKEALGLAKKGREKVQNLVKEYDEVRQKINGKKERMKRLKDILPVQFPEAEEIISEAEDRLQEEKYEESLAVLDDFEERFEKTADEKITEITEKLERLIEVGGEIGVGVGEEVEEADMEDISQKLDEAVAKSESSEYIEAAEIAKEGKKSCKDKIEAEIEDRRNRISREIEEGIYLDEETEDKLEDMLAKSRNKLSSENYIKADLVLDEAKEELERSQADSAERRIGELSEFLSMLDEELETEDIDLTSYMDDIEEAEEMRSKGEYKDSLDKTSEVEENLNEELKEKAERIFGRAKMEVTRAKKAGVDIEEFRKRLIECKKDMKEKNYVNAARISLETEKSAKKIRERRKETYEDISDTASRLNELEKEGKVDDVSEIKEILVEAKNEFRKEKYSTVDEMVKKAEMMIKKREVKRKKEELLGKVDEIKDSECLSVETADIKSDLEETSELSERDEVSKALEIIEKTDDLLDKRLKENLEELIDETETSVISAKNLGMDTEEIDLDLSEAKALVGKERYWDCLEILREIEEKIREFEKLREEADESIDRIKEKLREAEDINADSDEGRELLAEAKTAFEKNRYEKSIDRAEEAETKVEEALERQTGEIISRFKEKIDHHKSEKEDMSLADDFIQKAKRAKENGDYKEAINYSMQSEGELEKIELQQNIANKSISNAKEKLKKAEEKDLTIDRPKRMLEESIEAFKGGFYVKAFDKAVKVSNELNEMLEYYGETASFLENIEGIMKELKKEKGNENLDELVEIKKKVNGSFQDGDYEKAYSYLGEVEEVLEKDKIRDVVDRLQDEIEHLTTEGKEEVEELLEDALNVLDVRGAVKAVELINKAKKLSESKKEKIYKGTVEEAETLLRSLKKFGTAVKGVENKIEEAKRSYEENKVNKASKEAEKALDHVERILEDHSPEIKIKALEPVKLNEWNDTEIQLKNEGEGVAQDLDVDIRGGKIENFELEDKLKAGEEIEVIGRIKPTSEEARILGKAVRILDDKQLEDEYELQITDGTEREDLKEELCDLCQKAIKDSQKTISCSCGSVFHVSCTDETKECPNCGTEIGSDEEEDQKRVGMDI